MAEKPEGNQTPEKHLPKQGQESPIGKEQESEPKSRTPESSKEQAAQRLAETAWAPESLIATANAPSTQAGLPQLELVADRIVEGQLVKPDTVHKSWDLDDQQIADLARQVRQAVERRAFGGLGGPDPDTKQIATLVEGLKLSDRRALEMVLSKNHDFRHELATLLVKRPDEFKHLIAIFDRPDRMDNLPLDNAQAVHYAHRTLELLKDFSKEGATGAANLLAPLSHAEKQQVEDEMSAELNRPFRQWLHRQMPIGHHLVGLNNESIARIEAVIDQPDTGTDYKGSVKVLMGGLKDNWSANKENAILHILSGMDNSEIRQSGMFDELRNSPYLSSTAQQVLDVTLSGRDKWTTNPQQSRELAEIALKAKNLEIFKDAMQAAPAREYFRSKEGAQQIDQVFSGPFDSRDRQVAHDYAELNDTKLLTDLQMYQFALSPSREAITQRLLSATEGEKDLFRKGLEHADLRPKETDKEKAANRYYLDVYDALRSASKYDSNQLREWTGILSATRPKEEKPDPRKQILDMSKSSITGLDAIRQLEDILKKNPDLAVKLKGQDKELQTSFASTLKKISEDARNSAIAGNIWKDLTDFNNLNPISAMMSTPDRMKRHDELAQDISSSAQDNLAKLLLANGQLSLEQKLFVAGEKKLSADDLLTLQADEKQRLLKGQFPPKIQEAVFGKGKENEFIYSVLAKQDAKLTTLDQIRAFSLGRGSQFEQMSALMDQIPSSKRKELSDQYFEKYKSVMHEDILQQVKDPIDKARLLQSLRHVDDTAEQRLINTQIEQTKHAGPLDGLSEAYSPDQRMANKYSRAAESFYRQVKDGLTEEQRKSLDTLPQNKKQEIALALMKYQSALKKYWSAQKDYAHNKEEMSEQLADATLTAGAVIASIAQPELSPALLARTAVLSAAGRLGIKQAIMDKDFDTSSASVQKELYKGSMTGVLNSLGGEAFTSGRFVKLGKFGTVATNAAEKTVADVSSNQALKSVLQEGAEETLTSKLQQTAMNNVFGPQKKCMAEAKELAKSISKGATDEQLEVIANAIQKHRKQEVLNSLKGKVWHEGDQFATSITASIAGAAFAETAATVAGYEKPETLLKRLELSAPSAAVGGAVFHIGFKAFGKGVEGISGIIGRTSDGRLYAGPGTHVLTDKGKEIVVGKEPYYFNPNDQVVEIKPRAKTAADAPGELIAAAMEPASVSGEPPESSGRVSTVLKDLIQKKSSPIDAFDRLPPEHKTNLMNLSDERIEFWTRNTENALSVLQNPSDIAYAKQTLAYLNFIKATRERTSREFTLSHVADRSEELPVNKTGPETKDELSVSRKTTLRSPTTISQLSEIYGVDEHHIQECFGMTTDKLRSIAKDYREKLEKAPAGKPKEAFFRLSTFADTAENERLEIYKHKHPNVSTEKLARLTNMNERELKLQATFAETTYKSSTFKATREQYKNELALVHDLQAEHLSGVLDSNLGKRLLHSEKPTILEELRILHQENLRDLRGGINALIGKPLPEEMSAARRQITENQLAKIKGVPKRSGAPVAVTDSLASIPWRDGEILYSANRVVTVNDRIANTSRTINSSNQLIETLDNQGRLRHFTYDSPATNEVSKMVIRKDAQTITYERHDGKFQKSTIDDNGQQTIEELPHVIKIETSGDGSYSLIEKAGYTKIYPDNSAETHVTGRRVTHEANLQTEKARFRANIEQSCRAIEDTVPSKRQSHLGKSDFIALAAKRKERFTRLTVAFELRTVADKMPEQEQANFYKHLNRLLDENRESAISIDGRRELAEQVLYNATHTRDIAQGKNSTCNVTTIEKRCWAKYPAAMAQFAADVAEHGQFITTSGSVIDMRQYQRGTRPDIEARRSLKIQREEPLQELVEDGQRSWLSQMTQIAMVNSFWQKESRLMTTDLKINSPTIAFDSSNKLVGHIDPDQVTALFDEKDNRVRYWNGVSKVFDSNKQELQITKKDLVYDSQEKIIGVYDHSKATALFDNRSQEVKRTISPGEVIYFASGQEAAHSTYPGEIKYGKRGKAVTSNKEKEYLKEEEEGLFIKRGKSREYCRTEEGAEIQRPKVGIEAFPDISKEITGKSDDAFIVALNDKKAEYRNRIDISNKTELAEVLRKWQQEGTLPGIIFVNAGKPPFNPHYNPNDTNPIKHDWHVINVWGFDGTMVDATNQWSKKYNVKVSLDELFEAMSDTQGKNPFQ